MTAAQQRAVISALAAQPGTRHYLAVSTGQARLAGAAGRVSVTAYGGRPALAGAPLIAGRWYSAAPRAAEADVNTLFLTDTGTRGARSARSSRAGAGSPCGSSARCSTPAPATSTCT
jgi:hypothetical protein